MFVYRVETKSGKGAYTFVSHGYNGRMDLFSEYNGGSPAGGRHPTPSGDELHMGAFYDEIKSLLRYSSRHDRNTYRSKILFGFDNLPSLDNWFDFSIRSKMNGLEADEADFFYINEYEIDEKYTKAGMRQTVFFEPMAKRTRTLSLETMVEI